MVFSKKSKLLIVDDSAFMRKLISDFFEGNSKIEVVGTARNGKDALAKITTLKPDVVTMDVEMPEMNGLEALKEIMTTTPLPIIMLSSTTQSGAENTMIAMDYGAVDFIAKPSGTISLDLHKVKEELVRKIEQASLVPIGKLQRQASRLSQSKPVVKPIVTAKKEPTERQTITKPLVPVGGSQKDWSKTSKKVVLIGTSTGGPRALQEVITKLPKNIPAPILIVQHMPAGFTKSLANRLDQISEISVKEAAHGDVLQNGVAYIAPGGYHIKLRKIGASFAILLDNVEPPRNGHRPSVDVMFEDASQFSEFDKVAVVMTGMGNDGAKGLIELKKKGNVMAISESAETCIVYGMPKAAVETQLVDEVADVDDIAQAIMKFLP